MATFISQSSKNVSSFGALDDLQCSSIREKFQNDDSISLEQQRRAEDLADKGTKNCDSLTVPKVNITRESNNKIDNQKCSINACATKTKNIVAPSFSVGGLVSTHYQSQPNINDEVNNYEDTNQRNFETSLKLPLNLTFASFISGQSHFLFLSLITFTAIDNVYLMV